MKFVLMDEGAQCDVELLMWNAAHQAWGEDLLVYLEDDGSRTISLHCHDCPVSPLAMTSQQFKEMLHQYEEEIEAVNSGRPGPWGFLQPVEGDEYYRLDIGEFYKCDKDDFADYCDAVARACKRTLTTNPPYISKEIQAIMAATKGVDR